MANQHDVKSSFLLSKAISLPLVSGIGEYDSSMNLNISIEGEKKVPTVLCGRHVNTESKTFAAPSDDDPDAESENCY